MESYMIKPQEVSTVRWDGTNLAEVKELVGMSATVRQSANMSTIVIELSLADRVVQALDYIVRFHTGEVAVYRPDEFEAVFERQGSHTYEDGYSDGYATAYSEISCLSCDKPCGEQENRNTREQVNHPDHYRTNGKECIDGMAECFGIEDVMAWLRCSAYKYLWRKGRKGNAETDIRKAQWCVDRHNQTTASALGIDTIMRAIQQFINQ